MKLRHLKLLRQSWQSAYLSPAARRVRDVNTTIKGRLKYWWTA